MRRKKNQKRTTTKKNTNSTLIISFRRIIIPAILIVIGVVIFSSGKSSIKQSVLGTQVAKSLFAQAVIKLPSISGVDSYNIYYKSQSDPDFNNAVRNINPNITDYTISYLKKGTIYYYKISAVNEDGEEFWWSETQEIKNLQSM